MAEMTGMVGVKYFNAKWKLWSIKLEDQEDWIGCGKTEPQVEAGWHVKLEARKNPKSGRMECNPEAIEVVEQGEAPARKAPKSNGYDKANTTRNEYWETKAKIEPMQHRERRWNRAWDQAFEETKFLITSGLLKVTGKSKAAGLESFEQTVTERAKELYVQSEGVYDVGLSVPSDQAQAEEEANADSDSDPWDKT
jgi:hypothetical protein